MINRIQQLGANFLTLLANIGRSERLFFRVVFRRPSKMGAGFRGLVEQLYSVGVFSLPIIIVSGVFIGMVVGLQGQHTLEKFAASSALGQLVALSITRELGPVITALLFIIVSSNYWYG